VFWANEIMNTVWLGEAGILDPLPAGVAELFPSEWRDPAGRYVAFGARARILLVNTQLLPDEKDHPTSLEDLVDPKYAAMGFTTAMAAPLTGTTYAHAVAMLTTDEAAGKAFLERVAAAAAEKRVKIVPGNGPVMTQVRDSKEKVAFGLTDTDDAWAAIQAGFPVKVIYPEQAGDRPDPQHRRSREGPPAPRGRGEVAPLARDARGGEAPRRRPERADARAPRGAGPRRRPREAPRHGLPRRPRGLAGRRQEPRPLARPAQPPLPPRALIAVPHRRERNAP
jgi:iron(III) transport system substrate-binding protein